MVGGRWKSQNRKNVYLSPYVEEPLNSKVIKSFVPELRSRKCFLCFGIPMFYVYMLWTFYVHFAYPYLAMVQGDTPLSSCSSSSAISVDIMVWNGEGDMLVTETHFTLWWYSLGGVLGVMAIVIGTRVNNLSLNPGQSCLHFAPHYRPWKRHESISSSNNA